MADYFKKCPPEVVKLSSRVTLMGVLKSDATQKKWDGKNVLIYSREHDAFWRTGGAGYTMYVDAAGRYPFADALKRTKHCDKSKGIVFYKAPVPQQHRTR